MARFIDEKNSQPIVEAAGEWVATCLVEDGSIFGDERIWTKDNLNALDEHFVQHLDAGAGSFYEKLKAQLANAPNSAKQLMSELLWVFFLFPSNISIGKKRESIVKVWSWSGVMLDPSHPMLADAVLNGIGSGGPAINNHRWRELVFMISMGGVVKGMGTSDRKVAFASYEHFVEWIDKVPQDGERQFRQMLRYLLFPDRVERMSSNGDRIKVLAGFGVGKPKELAKWSDQQLDSELLQLRKELEAKYGTKELDFYRPPLRAIWKPEGEPDDVQQVNEPAAGYVARESGDTVSFAISLKARNLILYGPPGTGKTYRLQQLFDEYTDQPADLDRNTWELELVTRYGWRAAIATALSAIGRPAKVAELAEHPLIKAKALERQRATNIRPTLWGYLQEHTHPDVATVNLSNRRPPFVFTKSESSEWSLVPDWTELDSQSAELAVAWKEGPGAMDKPIQRYKLVTFHPSYSYEDFVIGLRPVSTSEGNEAEETSFRMVDGVFKQICAQAKANPTKPYAIFIDEINRANIAKVFGELITLVEIDKRARYDTDGSLIGGLEVQLPGTPADGDTPLRFGVPANLDIYGTMNTADRSIALLDIALRRRFEFEELPPLYDLLTHSVEGIALGQLLKRINDRLEYLLDRDHRIGHAYFMRVTSLDDLRSCFKLQIIPLLQEYFFDDWSRVHTVLSDHQGESPFIDRVRLDGQALFGGNDEVLQAEKHQFVVRDSATWDAAAFQGIYARASA